MICQTCAFNQWPAQAFYAFVDAIVQQELPTWVRGADELERRVVIDTLDAAVPVGNA